MSQPCDRNCSLSRVGELDEAAGQFWVGNPWEITSENHNLSAYEKNVLYLNLQGSRFADASFVSATDSDGDGRSALGVDLDEDGMQELIVRQAGGGALMVFRNRFPPRNWLRVTLAGTRSNAQGIGARLVAEVGGRRLVREMYPANTFMSQTLCEAHFGLDSASQVDALTIHWPSGQVQVLRNVAANQRLRVQEPVERGGRQSAARSGP